MKIQGRFKIDVYNCYVNVIVTDNLIKEVIRLAKLLDFEQEFSNADGACCISNPEKDPSNYYLVFDKKYLDSNFVNHEKSHVVEDILVVRGIKPKGETRCYLDGCISEKLYGFFKRKKIKIK